MRLETVFRLWQSMNGRYLLWLVPLLLLPACNQGGEDAAVVTRVVIVDGEQQIVTRVVPQTVAVTATPDPARQLAVLDVGFIGDLPSVDPQSAANDNAATLVENMFVGLTNMDPVDNLVKPELAESWEVSRDGRVWTFYLREDLFWVRPRLESGVSDGVYQAEPVRPVTAADVVVAVHRACSQVVNTPDDYILFLIENCQAVNALLEPRQADLDMIGVRAVDDTTLQISLTKPATQFLTITSTLLFHPLPPELLGLEEQDWQDVETFLDTILVSGPFMPVTWTADRVVLQRNEAWPLLRTGNVDVVNIIFLDRASEALELWQSQALDISPVPPEGREEFVDENRNRILLLPAQTLFYLGFNFDSGVFREPELRLAFSAAIDRERLIEELYAGRALPMRHLTPPGVLGAPPIDRTGVGYSPDEARLWLAESGFGSCRLMPPITYLVSTADLSLRQAELIRDMWVEELGCAEEQIIIEQVPFGTKLANTRRDAGGARPDVWELAWASVYPDAHNWLGDLLHCTDSENRQNRPCSEVDSSIRQAVQETDQATRFNIYQDVENLFFGADGLTPMAPLYIRGTYLAVQDWISIQRANYGGEQYDTYLIDVDLKRLERSR